MITIEQHHELLAQTMKRHREEMNQQLTDESIGEMLIRHKEECWSHMPTLFVIDDHIGGPINKGVYGARYAVENCYDYGKYIRQLHERLRMENPKGYINIYRGAPTDQLPTDQAEGAYVCGSTDLKWVKDWIRCPLNEGQQMCIYVMQVEIGDVVFEGNETESEFVVRNPIQCSMLYHD